MGEIKVTLGGVAVMRGWCIKLYVRINFGSRGRTVRPQIYSMALGSLNCGNEEVEKRSVMGRVREQARERTRESREAACTEQRTHSLWAREMHTAEGSADENYEVSSVWERRKGGLDGSKNGGRY